MANNKSAKKRIQIAERNRLINKSYKSTVKTFTKKTLENCEKYKKDPNEDNKYLIKTSLNKAFSLIDKAVKKNVIHKNNGAGEKNENKITSKNITDLIYKQNKNVSYINNYYLSFHLVVRVVFTKLLIFDFLLAPLFL